MSPCKTYVAGGQSFQKRPSSRSLPGARALRRLLIAGDQERGGRAVTRWKLGSRGFRGTSPSAASQGPRKPSSPRPRTHRTTRHDKPTQASGAAMVQPSNPWDEMRWGTVRCWWTVRGHLLSSRVAGRIMRTAVP